ncbi:MAG: DeoR/GlpR transcriptional regulator [Rhodospirillales bacterium]|nr:DeoR/GlpR transcriptional regulator [Rhodospirillales bacterium]
MMPAQHRLDRSAPTTGAAARLSRLAAMIAASGPLRLRDAAAALAVSEMTIRRDVAGADGLACLGGYVTATGGRPDGTGYVLHQEERAHMAGKRAAAEAAAASIRPGETIFIDCGTTMPFLAAALPVGAKLTVVCYALNIAAIVCRRAETRVILLGGLYHDSSASFWSRESEAMLGRIGLDRAFLSAGGIHRERGVSCSNFHEVPLKQIAMANAQESCLVADATKFERVMPAHFADLSAFHRIVTDATLAASVRQRFAAPRPRLEIAA